MIKKRKICRFNFFYCFWVYIMAKCKLLCLSELLELRWGVLTHLVLRKRLIYSGLRFFGSCAHCSTLGKVISGMDGLSRFLQGL